MPPDDASSSTDGAVERLRITADRLDELADVAELMDDEPTSRRLRGDAARCRDRAMSLLDGPG